MNVPTQAPSNSLLRLSDERITKLIEFTSGSNDGSMFADARLALLELSNRRAADKLQSTPEPPPVPEGFNSITAECLAKHLAAAESVTLRSALIELQIRRAAQPPVPAPKFKVGDTVWGACAERQVLSIHYRYRVSKTVLEGCGYTYMDESTLEPYSSETKGA